MKTSGAIILTCCVALSGGCQTVQPARPAAAVVCATVAPISGADMSAAAAELESMPSRSIIGAVIVPDWLRMRDEARACRKGSK